jgi:PAS domain S-box-containing protein
MSDEEIIAMAMARNTEMLSLLAENEASAVVESVTKAWIANQLPIVQRNQVVVEDIILVNFTRRKVLRDLLTGYTQDIILFSRIMEEIDRFTMTMDTSLFKSFIHFQQDTINSVNSSLKKRETELLEAQEVAQLGSFEWDLAGKNSTYTPQVYKIFEMEKTSDMQSFMNDVHPEDRERLTTAITKAMEHGDYECEYRYIRNQKEKVIWSRGKVTFQDFRPVKMTGTIMDVTARNKIVARLQHSESLHKQAQALTHIGNWSWDIDQNNVNWSDEMYRIYGLDPQSEVISLERFLSFVHPEDIEKRKAEIQQALQSLTVHEHVFRIISKTGAVKVLRGQGEIIADKHKKPIQLVGTCQDITNEFLLNEELAQRENHANKLNASLEQKNRELMQINQELESFNFVASHDLQEPLRKIRIYSDRLLTSDAWQLPEIARNYAERMHHAAGRMQTLIDDFLAFSKTVASSQDFVLTDLAALFEEVKYELATPLEDTKATLTVAPLPVVWGIPFQLKQLMINLISNSLKYRKKDTPPQINIMCETVHGNGLMIAGAASEKTYTKITVADNGIGFDQRYAQKIFDLFQRLHTKDDYSGTGIGLAICKKVIESHSGFITVLGNPGEGAVFTIFLPIH